jgi:hypothetical protein
MKKPLLILILLLFCPIFMGCAVAPLIISPIVTGVIVWKEGEARKYYNEGLGSIYRATKNSLKEINLQISEDKTLKNGDFYLVADKENSSFKITIRQIKPNITEVKIRVGFMGDKPYAEFLFDHIDLNVNSIEFDDLGKPVKRLTHRFSN